MSPRKIQNTKTHNHLVLWYNRTRIFQDFQIMSSSHKKQPLKIHQAAMEVSLEELDKSI